MKKLLIVIGLLIIIILIIVIPKFLKDLRSAQNKLSLYKTSIIDTPIAPIEYYRTGRGQPILISHGITGGFDQGLGLAKAYIGGDYDLIAVSRFGYLNSPLPKDSSPEAQAEAYKHLLDELKIDKAFIFGNSAGGTSAFKFALKYPERCSGLILVSSNVPQKNYPKAPPKPIMRVVFGSNFAYWSFVKLMGNNMLSMVGVPKSLSSAMTKEEKVELINDVPLGSLPIGKRTKGVLNDFYLSNPDINNNYPFEQIKVPVIMINGKDDNMVYYDGALAVSKRISDTKLVSFENGGHLLLDHEEETQKEIAAFINKNK